MAGILEGIRVVDFTQGTAGPYASMILAEQGADVVKVEPPEGDRTRGTPAFHALNRSKRSVVLDLAAGEDLRRAQQLAGTADVVLVDELPQRADEIGIGYERLRHENQALIYCSLPLYGSKGPWASLSPDDNMLGALSGLFAGQRSYSGDPVFLVIPVASYTAGVLAAASISATLFDRRRTGEGDLIEVSGLSGAFVEQIAALLAPLAGQPMIHLAGLSAFDPKGPLATYRVFQCADDKWFMMVVMAYNFFTKLLVHLGMEDLLVKPEFALAAISDDEMRAEFTRRLEKIFRSKSRDEWVSELEEAGLPVGPVLTRDEFIEDAQVSHNKMIVSVEDPELGPTRQVAIPFVIHGAEGAIRGGAPLLGQHTNEAFSARTSTHFLPQRGPSLRSGDAPLRGVRVIDLGTVYAGGLCGMLPSDLGADVVKVEPLDGDPTRALAVAFLGVNRGKRSLAIDLRKDEGLQVLYQMVRQADVFVENFRAGVTRRMRIDYETLAEINPRVIYCSMSPYGPDGPLSRLPGYDPILGARSGLCQAQGGEGQEPYFVNAPASDWFSALFGAYGVGLALYERERTGRGRLIETSLLNNILAAQQVEFIRYERRPPVIPGGRDLLGVNAGYRTYRCRKGYLLLAVQTRKQAEALLETAGLEGQLQVEDVLSGPLKGDAALKLEAYFAVQKRDQTLRRLIGRGIPCAPCLALDEIKDDEHLQANDMWWDMDHPVMGPYRQTGAVVKFGKRSMHLQRPAPVLGEHSREVLLQYGVSEGRIDQLLADGIVTQSG